MVSNEDINVDITIDMKCWTYYDDYKQKARREVGDSQGVMLYQFSRRPL